MGEVWLAHDTRLDTACAVKFLHASALEGPAARARFEREARAAAQLRSPNVVQILDHGEYRGEPYIAMEMLQGEDLATRLRRLERIDPGAMLEIVTQIAKALTRAHGAGLVHRDLKPANVFIVPDDDGELVKVLDFGVVKSIAAGAPASVRATTSSAGAVGATHTGQMLGTPNYMSPEQATGDREIDTRSDLWSLGVLTFQCLTGRLPFVGTELGDLVMKILLDPVPKASDLVPTLGPGVDAWFERALARDPRDRFQTARELADAFAQAISGTTATSVPSASPATPMPARPAERAAPILPSTSMVARRGTWRLIVFGLAACLVVAGVARYVMSARVDPNPKTSTSVLTTSASASARPAVASRAGPLILVAPFPRSSQPAVPQTRKIPPYTEESLVRRVQELGWTLLLPARTDKAMSAVSVRKELCSGMIVLMVMENDAAARSYFNSVIKSTANEFPVLADGNRVLNFTVMGPDQSTSRDCAMQLYRGVTEE